MIAVPALKEISVFSDWTDKELEKIIPYLLEESIEKGQLLFQQNDPPLKFYFVKSGCIELRMEITAIKDTRLAHIKTGEMFGEMSVIDNKPRSATAAAFVATGLISMSKDKFYEFLTKHDKGITSKLLLNIIKDLSLRLRIADDEIRHLKLYT